MKVRPGFTIIELVIAAAITVLVLSVSLPRFSAVLKKQDFATNAQNLVRCLQSAQQEAASPSQDTQAAADVSVRSMNFVRAVITKNSSTRVTCTYDFHNFDGTTFVSVPMNPAKFTAKSTVLNNFSVTKISYPENATFSAFGSPATVYIYFSMRDKGIVRYVCSYSAAPIPPECNVNSGAVGVVNQSYGNGLALNLELQDPSTAGYVSEASKIKGQIKMPILAIPIGYDDL